MHKLIHIVTVHWNSSEWIDLQLKYLRNHLKTPYRIYAWLNNIVPLPPAGTFHHVRTEAICEHEVKLNILGDTVCMVASDDDILIFLDGDAFPIADLEPFLTEKLPTHRLVAVQRFENNGDIQPHPCFCATTVGFWREIKGDWSKGHPWKDADGDLVSDVGGNLLKQLTDRQIDWHPMLRSNSKNPHPVLFGVYEDLIYHHGAAFRHPITRVDFRNIRNANGGDTPLHCSDAVKSENKLLSDEVFTKIRNDPAFVTEFI